MSAQTESVLQTAFFLLSSDAFAFFALTGFPPCLNRAIGFIFLFNFVSFACLVRAMGRGKEGRKGSLTAASSSHKTLAKMLKYGFRHFTKFALKGKNSP